MSSTLLAVAASSLSIKWIPELVDGVAVVNDSTGGDNDDKHSLAITSSFKFNSSDDFSVSLDFLSEYEHDSDGKHDNEDEGDRLDASDSGATTVFFSGGVTDSSDSRSTSASIFSSFFGVSNRNSSSFRF